MSPGQNRATERALIPDGVSTGSSQKAPLSLASFLIPSILGVLGPWRSASNTPTRYPAFWSAAARFTVVAVLPTPPLPESPAIL